MESLLRQQDKESGTLHQGRHVESVIAATAVRSQNNTPDDRACFPLLRPPVDFSIPTNQKSRIQSIGGRSNGRSSLAGDALVQPCQA